MAGFGVVGEIATGFPGYDSVIRKENGTIGEILKENGYATSWFGKDHNTPFYQATQAGPFDQWPNGMGFEYFYGSVGGDTSQWQPDLYRNTTAIYPYEGHPRMESDDSYAVGNTTSTAQNAPTSRSCYPLVTAWHALATSSDAGMDQEDRRYAPVRRRLEQTARNHLHRIRND